MMRESLALYVLLTCGCGTDSTAQVSDASFLDVSLRDSASLDSGVPDTFAGDATPCGFQGGTDPNTTPCPCAPPDAGDRCWADGRAFTCEVPNANGCEPLVRCPCSFYGGVPWTSTGEYCEPKQPCSFDGGCPTTQSWTICGTSSGACACRAESDGGVSWDCRTQSKDCPSPRPLIGGPCKGSATCALLFAKGSLASDTPPADVPYSCYDNRWGGDPTDQCPPPP